MKNNIVVFASGNGSNFINIFEHLNRGYLDAKIVLLISNNPKCGAVDFAKKNQINYKIINDFRYPLLKNKNKEYELVLQSYKTDLILLAGFMKKIPKNIVEIYKDRIMNIHPSLLPKYGGKGYYGIKVHNEVIKSNEKKSGASVHLVNSEYDKGEIIIQKEVKINASDTADTLASKVLKIEHQIYPEAIEIFLSNNVKRQ
tara:strand:+ start:103 stop:702 length:600 start_codon:yes stop_codon:yes gene_type:complete